MTLKNKRSIIILFLILAIVNITPATAMSLGDINSQMENDINTYNSYNWWQKLWNTGSIISSLFNIGMKLKDEAANIQNQIENALNEAGNAQNKIRSINSLINDYNTNSQNEKDKKDKIIADTEKNIQENMDNSIENDKPTENRSNETENNTNKSSDESKDPNYQITNHSNGSQISEPVGEMINQKTNNNLNQSTKSNESSKNNLNQTTKEFSTNNLNTNHKTQKNTQDKVAISDYSRDDAEKYVKSYFKNNNITYSELELQPTKLKNGYIIQLFKDGVYKYWVFEGYNTQEKTKFAKLTTGNGNIVLVDSTTFKNAFTGLAYNLNGTNYETNAHHAVKDIQKLQIESLDSKANTIKTLTDWATAGGGISIAGGIISGIATILGIFATICALIAAAALAATVTVVLGIPCATIASICKFLEVVCIIGAVIGYVIGIPMVAAGEIIKLACNNAKEQEITSLNRLSTDYNSDII